MKAEHYELEIQNTLACLKNGGIILYPTEAMWCLGCDAHDADAVERIIQLKNYKTDTSMMVLMNSIKDILKYIATPPLNIDVLINQFERPTTIFYPNAINLPSELMAPDGSLGIRLTNDPFCRSLISRLKHPIVAAPANLNSQNYPNSFKDIDSEIICSVDYVVKYRQDEVMPATPLDIYIWKQKDGLSKVG